MELKSCTYATVTTLGDFGPWISKVVLDLPCTGSRHDIDARHLPYICRRHERTGARSSCAKSAAPTTPHLP